VEAYAICQNCTVPAYEKIDKGQKYSMIISNFILNGGDGYGMIAKYAEQSHTIGK
jgi:5'-nucleotidase